MMERNHRGTNRGSSMPGDHPGGDHVAEKVSVRGNHGFPRRTWQNDDPIHGGSEDFVPHIITRMPDLTGYGHDTAPQSISLSRPKHRPWILRGEILKKLPVHHWKYVTAIAVVVAILGWSLFRGAGTHQVVQNPLPDSPKTEKVSQDNAAHPGQSAQESNKYQFDGFHSGFPPIPESSTSAGQPMFFSGTTASLTPQNQSFGNFGTENTPYSPYSSSVANVAMIPPDAPAREPVPWERQPDHRPIDTTLMSSQFDFTGNVNLPMTASADSVMAGGNMANNMMAYNDVMVNNVPNSFRPGVHPDGSGPGAGHPHVADPLPWNSNHPRSHSDMNASPVTWQNAYPQDIHQANNAPQNGQYQPASPQQTYYPQHPGYNNAIAMNTANMPSYPQGLMQVQGQVQGQGQWPPQNTQNTGNMPNPGDGSQGFNMHQPYPGNASPYTAGSPYTMQNNTSFAPQQQQPFLPYHTAVSPPQDTYR